jgi:hypothetical protein
MIGRTLYLVLLAFTVLLGVNTGARAAAVKPPFDVIAKSSSVIDVRWVCGPYRCAWIPAYRGPVVVYPHMRGWVRPPSLHCFYERRLFGWTLVCP